MLSDLLLRFLNYSHKEQRLRYSLLKSISFGYLISILIPKSILFPKYILFDTYVVYLIRVMKMLMLKMGLGY